MELSDTFDQKPPCTFDKIRETHSDEKRSHGLTLRAKFKVIAKSKDNDLGNKKSFPKKFEHGFPS